ncbi:hypothetical protein diail_10370, partial [Diaporthe ilicicola]
MSADTPSVKSKAASNGPSEAPAAPAQPDAQNPPQKKDTPTLFQEAFDRAMKSTHEEILARHPSWKDKPHRGVSPDTALRFMEEMEKEDRELPDGTEGDGPQNGLTTCHKQQYPSPDTSFLDDAAAPTTPAPPSPPPSSSCSTTSPAALPPSVVPAFQCLQDSSHGIYTGPSSAEFPGVRADDVEALVFAAESRGVSSCKIRYDYDPSSELLILRMPEGKPHNFTKNRLASSIWKHLTERLDLAATQIREGQEIETRWQSKIQALQDLKLSVEPTTEASVTLPTGEQKSPDISYYYADFIYPPLVVEVGHSQKGTQLPLLARRYVEKTGGDIHTVITVDIAHNDPRNRAGERRRRRRRLEEQGRETRSRSRLRRESAADSFRLSASVSLFRLGKRVVHDQPFRDADGGRVDGGLELNVADFVPLYAETAISREDLEGLTFAVPFSDLFDALARGERRQVLEEETSPPQAAGRSGKKRVHLEFDWELPDAAGTRRPPGFVAGAGGEGGIITRGLRSSSKRRKTSPEMGSRSSRSLSSSGSLRERRGSDT